VSVHWYHSPLVHEQREVEVLSVEEGRVRSTEHSYLGKVLVGRIGFNVGNVLPGDVEAMQTCSWLVGGCTGSSPRIRWLRPTDKMGWPSTEVRPRVGRGLRIPR